jgi:hypothetical protein
MMAIDRTLFTRAISGYRDAFLSEYAHLPKSDQDQLWTQQLAEFIPVAETGAPDTSGVTTGRSHSYSGPSSDSTGNNNGSGSNSNNIASVSTKNVNLGKRTRQDASRTGSGVSPAKRQATVCLLVLYSNLPSVVPSPSTPSWNLTISRLRNPSMNRPSSRFRPLTR